MRSNLIKAFAIVLGLLAMLSCLHTPVAAEPLERHNSEAHLHALPLSTAPCCPDKGTASHAACSQHGAVIAPMVFAFAHLPLAAALTYELRLSSASGVSYTPTAPPPR